MTYLERYLNGDYEQVWQELIALGDQVRQDPIYSDALAVARETMNRARRNVEIIYTRLKSIGYEFEAERNIPRKGISDLFAALDKQMLDDELAKSILSPFRESMETKLQMFQNLLGQANLNSPEQQSRRNDTPIVPPQPGISAELDEFERSIGPIPLSIRAWCEIVGSVDFNGNYPRLCSRNPDLLEGGFNIRKMMRNVIAQSFEQYPDAVKRITATDEETMRQYYHDHQLPFRTESLMGIFKMMKEEANEYAINPPKPREYKQPFIADPLVFQFNISVTEAKETLEDEDYLAWVMDREDYNDKSGEQVPYYVQVAPDATLKANYSSDTYEIKLPNTTVDTEIMGADRYFVDYLRNSFRWGGFPGLADYEDRDDDVLMFLKEGLEPI